MAMIDKIFSGLWMFILILCLVQLWHETVAMCPMRCKCEDEVLQVDCNSAQLDVVPITLNPELRVLRLSNNLIKSVRTSFIVYHNLEFLDVSHNQLPSLDKGSFETLIYVNTLLLNNNLISVLQNYTFKGLESLQTLHLNENYLRELTSKSFEPLDNLELLDLTRNSITNIDPYAFYGLKSLKTLLLRDNKLSAIPNTSFQPISRLLMLDIGLNFLEVLPDNSFASLTDLQDLSLDGCGLRVIYVGAFRWLGSLLILRIHDNELKIIPTTALFDVPRLKELHIGQNKFSDVKAKSFQGLKYLSHIEINGCPNLNNIENNAFSENPDLKAVVINHNKELKYIQDDAFINLPNVQHVSLRSNSFETIQHQLFSWDELQYFDVRDNPFACNCSLMWLWKILSNKNFSSTENNVGDTRQIICVNPAEVKNKVLLDLSSDDFDCYSMTTRRQIIISSVSISTISLCIIVLLGFKYREKLAGVLVLKTKWGRSRKEPHYQKTNADEESTILQAGQQSLKNTPVTEL